MTNKPEIKTLFENYVYKNIEKAQYKYPEHTHGYENGFRDCLDLITPLISSLEWYASEGNCDCSREPWHDEVDLCEAHVALQSLVEKLKG